jgi:hypothetical protein
MYVFGGYYYTFEGLRAALTQLIKLPSNRCLKTDLDVVVRFRKVGFSEDRRTITIHVELPALELCVFQCLSQTIRVDRFCYTIFDTTWTKKASQIGFTSIWLGQHIPHGLLSTSKSLKLRSHLPTPRSNSTFNDAKTKEEEKEKEDIDDDRTTLGDEAEKHDELYLSPAAI